MMYTMPKNLLSICVNFALATQRCGRQMGVDRLRSERNLACPARAQEGGNRGFLLLVNQPLSLEGTAKFAELRL